MWVPGMFRKWARMVLKKVSGQMTAKGSMNGLVVWVSVSHLQVASSESHASMVLRKTLVMSLRRGVAMYEGSLDQTSPDQLRMTPA